MLQVPYPLVSERLVLRRFETGDIDDYFAYQQLPETARYLFGEPRSYQECLGRVQMYIDSPFQQEGDWASFAVERRDMAGLIGKISLKWGAGGKPETAESGPQRVGELGWSLAPKAQGAGFATEAARMVLNMAFGELGFHRLEARLDLRNSTSAAICERLGMQLEGVHRDCSYQKGEWISDAVYAALRD
ncbi:GNAT family N-acetyltransferase [Arthrobacter antibioticus]|uniref:GNAT family N-acetyltransferase n=1 Tax=Arthrobacter sp. H35-MC1 TaxID=3046203 RepID=UPI0024BAEAF3|nr:GNAT family N-acetyltransferase [Arthrobacter sp. H35-MC1]MDJ0318655.1 GNAT family N-acetyltransferase [Arthrobacter sp. H35-MC1]